MDDKYYTPEIEEFHVGFEYEQKPSFTDGTVKTQEDFDREKWKKRIFKVGYGPYINRALYGRNRDKGICGIRVKYLDREDIESLGFKEDINEIDFPVQGFVLEKYKDAAIYLYRDTSNYFVDISKIKKGGAIGGGFFFSW